MGANSYFKTLGLSPEASWDEVKSAFRRLARTYHPDIAGPSGARKFAEITEAYMSLKDTISPGAASGPARSSEGEAYRAYGAEAEPRAKSLWRRLWEKLSFGFSRREEAESAQREDYDFSPARARFIGSALSRAEAQLSNLLSRRGEIKEKNRVNALLFRLRSKHPSVVLLALQQLSLREAGDEIRSAVMEHFTQNIPTSEVLESLLSLFSAPKPAQNLTKILAAHAEHFSSADAQIVLRWLKRQGAGKGCFAPFLSHRSNAVVAAALSGWAPSFGLPDTQDLAALLKSEDSAVLVALLRLLKREPPPAWCASRIVRISLDHPSSAVRVWASAIVRDRNLG